MDNDGFELNERIGAALSGRGARKAAAALAARLAEGGAVADVRLGQERDAVLMAAIAARVDAEPGLKVLVVTPGDRDVAGLKAAFDASGGRVGLSCSTIGRDGLTVDAAVAIGSLDAIASCAASGLLEPRDFGLVALSDLDAMADAANAAMLRRAIGPASASRRFLAFASEPGPAHRSIVRDLGGPVVEMELEAEGERAKNAETATYSVSVEDKQRLLLGLMASGIEKPVAVFCALRDTAEAAAKALRSSGVRTEYVLGNLPRKRAVQDAVKAGEYDVLVLTDEGASGLPGSWAGSVVNWDLPLEGEPYLARLEHLDASRAGAMVCNFACDRYSFGIPAIERVLGARLEIVKADESMMVSGAPSRDEGGRRAGGNGVADGRSRQRPEPPRQESPKPDAARGPGRRNGDDRRDRGDRGGQYDGRNARAIQADIAAITGGKPSASLDEKAAPEPSGTAGKKRGRKGRPAVRQASDGTRKPQAQAGDTARRGGEPGKRRDASQPSRQGARRAKGGSGQRLADPYSVSMEERLKLYRERYADGNGAGKPAKADGGARGAARGAQKGSAGGSRQDQASKRGPAREHRADSPARGQGSGRPQPAAAQKAAEPRADGHPAKSGTAPKGLFGAIKSLFGKKEE